METSDSAGTRALRRGRASIVGQIYILTLVTAGRYPYFARFVDARAVIGEMSALHLQGHVDSLAFVAMPDHVHWLCALQRGQLGKVVQLLKSRSARRINGWEYPGRRIWQRGFHDRACRRHENVVAAARYIVMNPVRAGLVADIGDYPHWDAVWF
jgi:REP element-mobilizing transposase RayT